MLFPSVCGLKDLKHACYNGNGRRIDFPALAALYFVNYLACGPGDEHSRGREWGFYALLAVLCPEVSKSR